MVDKILRRAVKYKLALAHDPKFKLSDLYILRLTPIVIMLPFLIIKFLFSKNNEDLENGK
jgi:hypothetical protein